MPRKEPEHQGAADSFDQVAADLRRLRLGAGEVSYAEIVRRIAKHREANGIAPSASRPARTTIYDAFRMGRSRINAQLVGDIVRALGAGEEEVADWVRRCILVRHDGERGRTVAPPGSKPGRVVRDGAERSPLRTWARRATLRRVLLAMVCLGINFAGYCAVAFFELSLYMDATGTGLAAIALGPRWGVAVGVSTNILGSTIHGSMAFPFALQSATFALVWGYGARMLGMTRTLRSYFRLNVFAGLSHLFVAIPIILIIFGGGTGHAGDAAAHKLVTMGAPLGVAVYLVQTILALADALLAGFVIMMLMGFIKTQPPFRDDCAQFFPFYDPPSAPSALARVVTITRGRYLLSTERARAEKCLS